MAAHNTYHRGSRAEPRRQGGETNSKLPSAQHPEEVTQSRHKRDAAQHSEAPSLNTLRVVSMSGVASHVSDLVTTCESARIHADGSTGG